MAFPDMSEAIGAQSVSCEFSLIGNFSFTRFRPSGSWLFVTVATMTPFTVP
ncbi:hypothetical protein D3C71_2242470 [compost metagenome]